MNALLKLLARNTANFIIAMIPLAFYQPFYDPFGPAQLSVARIFIPLLALAAAYFAFRSREAIAITSSAALPLTVYCLICFLSVIPAINREISLKYSYEMLIFIGGAVLMHSFAGEKGMRRLLTIVIAVNAVNGTYGVMQHFGIDPFSWNTNFAGRPMGTIGNPDFYAGQLLLGAFLSAGRIIYEKKYRLLNIILLVPVLLYLIYARVVCAWIGFIAGATFMVIAHITFKPAYRKQLIIAAVIIAAVAASGSPYALKKIGESKKRSIDHRLIMWKAAVDMFAEKPVLGKGMGMYRLNYPKYQAVLLNESKDKSVDYVVTWMPHQNYLLVLAETGLLGLLALLWAFVLFVKGSASAMKEDKKDSFGMSAAVFAVLGASLVNTFYNIPATTLYFFLFITALSFKKRALPIRGLMLKTVVAAAAVLLAYSVFQDSRTLLSNVYLKKANKLADQDMHAKAIEMYSRIISMKPVELNPQADVGMYYFAAESHRKAGMPEKARELYAMDLAINPFCPEVNNMYGAISGQLGDLDTAVKHIKTAVYAAPHYEAAYTNLATAYMAKGDRASAREALQRYIEYNGTNERIEYLLKAAGK